MPTKLIKKNSDNFGDFIFGVIIIAFRIPNYLKNAIITPVHKKGAKAYQDNYIPVSILSNISKIYERLMFKQISKYFELILSKFQCGFRIGFSALHCPLAMLAKWKSEVDNKINFGALFSLTCPKLSTPTIFY